MYAAAALPIRKYVGFEVVRFGAVNVPRLTPPLEVCVMLNGDTVEEFMFRVVPAYMDFATEIPPRT